MSFLARISHRGGRRLLTTSSAVEAAQVVNGPPVVVETDSPKPSVAKAKPAKTVTPSNLFIPCDNSAKAKVVKLDKQFIVVNKPNNILSQPDETGDESIDESVADFLKTHHNKPGKAFVAVVHRLDRPASGLMVLATTTKAASRLAEQIRERTFKKDYLAVVPMKNLGAHRDGVIEGAVEDETLHWKQVHTVRNLYSVLHVKISSGKKHQIRRQLTQRDIGPVIGDLRFGSEFQTHKDFPPSKGIMLHASRLCFTHPTRPDEVIDVSCPPPWPEEFLPYFFTNNNKGSESSAASRGNRRDGNRYKRDGDRDSSSRREHHIDERSSYSRKDRDGNDGDHSTSSKFRGARESGLLRDRRGKDEDDGRW